MNPVPLESLQRLASMAPTMLDASNTKESTVGLTDDTRNGNHNDYEAWARAALEKELTNLHAAPVGKRNDQLNKSAYSLGQLVGGGFLYWAEVQSALEQTASAIGLEPSEIKATIRSGLEAGMSNPRYGSAGVLTTKATQERAISAISVRSTDSPPEPPGPLAYAGLAGEFVWLADKYTEADPVAVLAHFLTTFGCALGRGPHFMVGATRHDPRIFPLIVGKSSKARKGDSFTPVRAIFEMADPDFLQYRVQSGLASGEGLINAVRDPASQTDTGVSDKRLLVIEPEFARLLKVMTRQGNTLNAIIRDAWDRDRLQNMTKNAPLQATGAHICIVGHITTDELRRELTDTDAANGFANRFITFWVQRSKFLPEPEIFEGEKVERLAQLIAKCLSFARAVGCMVRDEQAREVWRAEYDDLSADRDGLVGSILARAEAQVVRLAMIYALLDSSAVVRLSHLQSALELWRYSERCADRIFGNATGDRIADDILRSLKQRGRMTRTEIYNLFNRHASSTRISLALDVLVSKALAAYRMEVTGGRPVEVWEPL